MSHSLARPSRDLLIDVTYTADGAFVVDLRQRILSWNAAAEALLGYREQEVLGKQCGAVLGMCGNHGADCTSPGCNAITNIIRGRLTPCVEVTARTKTGDIRWLSLSTMTAHTPAGEARIVHLFRDITEQRQAAQTAQQAGDRQPRRMVSASATRTEERRPPLTLTRREYEVLRLLAIGQTTSEIATALSISPITARNHVTRVIEKLEVKTRLQAVVVASRFGLI
jgi:DNA-binding CsgD family transcriptional regulator